MDIPLVPKRILISNNGFLATNIVPASLESRLALELKACVDQSSFDHPLQVLSWAGRCKKISTPQLLTQFSGGVMIRASSA